MGIAISGGTDVAIETADIALLKPSLYAVCEIVDLSRAVIRRIKLNFVWAFAYNLLGVPLAAGVFYPHWGWHLPPMFAGAAMALSSTSVVCSSLLLRRYRPPKPHEEAASKGGKRRERARREAAGDQVALIAPAQDSAARAASPPSP